uniref:Uncharacterized protein n=1 Tax=Buteo japonicus TaxID=224669 RepID=A0A8B9Z0M1_9AVES
MHSFSSGAGASAELEHPVADVGDGEGFVIADIGAARLLGVAHKIRLLVPPYRLPGQAQDEDAEDEEHGEPDLPDHRRVLLDLVQQFLQETPVAHLLGTLLSGGLRRGVAGGSRGTATRGGGQMLVFYAEA